MYAIRPNILSFFLFLLFVQTVSCKTKPVDKKIALVVKQGSNTTFKAWLRDTLVKLHAEKDTHYQQTIRVYEDSLSLDITNSYNLLIDKKYKGNNEELIYALDLLDRNNLLPAKAFRLDFSIMTSYSKSVIDRFVYDFDSEFKKYDAHYGDSQIRYYFLKGNLIDRTALIDTTQKR